jgi:hypothetical protein
MGGAQSGGRPAGSGVIAMAADEAPPKSPIDLGLFDQLFDKCLVDLLRQLLEAEA